MAGGTSEIGVLIGTVILSRIWILVGIDRNEKPLHLFSHSLRSSDGYVSPHDTASGRTEMDSRNSDHFQYL